ncbi:hypothetical protein Lal_00021717 [Lupinus albus]|nr:hypothetical protein Lal_00021717 [Lupinus albus]
MSASLVNKSVLFIIVTIFVTLQLMVGVVSGSFLDTDVTFSNSLLVPITIHCQDKNHDDGDFLTVKFTRDFLTRTLRVCSFKWEKEIHYIDIYVQKRHSCNECRWMIRTNGLCLNIFPDIQCYPWNDKVLEALK